MNGSTSKQIRRKAQQYTAREIVRLLDDLLRQPFWKRFRFCLTVMRGKPRAKKRRQE